MKIRISPFIETLPASDPLEPAWFALVISAAIVAASAALLWSLT